MEVEPGPPVVMMPSYKGKPGLVSTLHSGYGSGPGLETPDEELDALLQSCGLPMPHLDSRAR